MFKKWFGFGKQEEEKKEEILQESEKNKKEENTEQDMLPEQTDSENMQVENCSSSEITGEEAIEEIQEHAVSLNISEEYTEELEQIEVNDDIEQLQELQTDLAEEETAFFSDTDVKEEEKTEKIGFFARLKQGLTKTTKNITGRIDIMLGNYTKIDDDMLEELEEILITSDVGFETTVKIVEKLRENLKNKHVDDVSKVKPELKLVVEEMLKEHQRPLTIEQSPTILIVVGVNGVGKTTSIGKLAHQIKGQGKTVLLAAADTFRAAAAEQLSIWAERAGVEIIKHQEGADPSAVIFDGIHAAKKRNTDVLICDTAGRLHNRKNLMQELGKIFKVIDREYPEAQKEVLLVIDATTGQNAMNQAKVFKEVAPLTGIILTKLDGTAKGGVVLAISEELEIPVKFVGVGEQINGLQTFDATSFAEAMLGE